MQPPLYLERRSLLFYGGLLLRLSEPETTMGPGKFYLQDALLAAYKRGEQILALHLSLCNCCGLQGR